MIQKSKHWLLSLLGAVAIVAIAGPAFAEAYGAGERERAKEHKDLAVQFERESAELTRDARDQLDEAALWLRADEDRTIVLLGAREGPEFRERALAARDHLMARGVSPDRVFATTAAEVPQIEELRTEDRQVVYLLEEGQRPADLDLRAPEVRPERPAEVRDPMEPRRDPQRIDEAFVVDVDDDRPAHLITPGGVAISIGGGIMDFIGSDARNFTNLGGTWEARLTYGTRLPIAVEAAYIGSAQGIDAIGLDPDAVLLGNGGEATLRLNGGPLLRNDLVQPYIFGGFGVMHYNIVNADFNESNVADNDTLLTIPVGAGVAFNMGGFVLDIRGTVRPVFQDDLLVTDDGQQVDMHNWAATARLGWEF